MKNLANYILPTGQVITFEVCDYYGEWKNIGGIYAFCRFDKSINAWVPMYVGKTDNLNHRFSNHSKWLPALLKGATNVLVIIVPSESDRDLLERILIRDLDPPLNTQLKLGAFTPGLGAQQIPNLGLGGLYQTQLGAYRK